MAGPWEQYQGKSEVETGPWSQYHAGPEPVAQKKTSTDESVIRKDLPPGSSVSPSKSLPPSLNTIYAPKPPEWTNTFGPGLMGKGIEESITPGDRLEGVHHLLTGALETIAPFAIPAAIANPLAALLGVGGGVTAGAAGKYGSRAIGAPEDVSDLIGDAAGFGGGAAGAKFGSLASDLFSNPAARAAALKIVPRGDKISDFLSVLHGSPSNIVMPSGVTGGEAIPVPEYPRPISDPLEPGPGLWSRSEVKAPRPVTVSPSARPQSEPLESGPGLSGSILSPATGFGGNPQTVLSGPRSPRPSIEGIPNPSEYTFSGGNQYRIPSVAPPPVKESTPSDVPSGIVRIGQTPAERIQELSRSTKGTVGTRAEMMRQLRLADIHGTMTPKKAAIIRRFEAPEYKSRVESQVIAPKPVQ